MSKMDQTNDKTEDLSDKVASEDVGAGNHSLPKESNSNHCAINLLTDTNDSASSEGLDSVESNHCAIALKSDSNNCDTNLLSSNTCDMTSEPCDSPQSVDQEITADVQHDDSALVLSPVSEGSMMDISGGLEIPSEALYLTSTGVDSLQITRKDDSGICVDKEDIVRFKLQSTDSSSDDRKSSQQYGETEVMRLTQGHDTERTEEIVIRDKLAANLQEDEDMFMDSDEQISQNTDIVENLSRNSGTNQDVQSKDTDKDSLSVLDSPECSDKCHKEKAREKGLVLVPGFSSDEDGEQLKEEAACQLKKKKVKPLVDYDDSDDDTSGPTSYDVPNEKRSSDKSASSSSSESEDEMDALDVFLARRKRQMDSDRSSQGSRHGNNDDEDMVSIENRNMAEHRTHVDSEEEEEGVVTYSQPKDPWSPLLEVRARELGFNNTTYGPEKFRTGCGASVKFAQRLQRQSKLETHEGCVNALHFNKSGTSLASGSDDLNIVVWDWIHEKPFFTFDSGHRSNVFQCKFMPYTGDCHMVSCARDGQVRLAELSTTGKCKNTKKLALHKGAAHKLALLEDSSHVFYSCGEDAVVYEIDLRQDKPNKLCTTREKERKIPLYSIHSNPFKSYEYCVGGRDHFLRVYDKRKISGDGSGDSEVKKFCPHHLINSDIKANVTCAVYNWNGMEVLGTYNDEDIYLFDNTHSDGADHIARYKGHRNNATVKGVNFYGPKSEFVVSGSDCGNVFLWEKQSQMIVNFFKADEAGVVNVLEPHPHMPVLATSGLDHDVKVWSPHAPEATKLEGLSKLIKKNRKERTEERSSDPDMYDGHMLWFLMHHLRRARRMRGADGGGSSTDSDDVERGESENSEDDEPMQCVQS